MADYAPRVKEKLQENGFFYYKPGKGDHEKWKNQDGKIVIVDHKILSRHTANGILKQAGYDARTLYEKVCRSRGRWRIVSRPSSCSYSPIALLKNKITM